LEIESNEANREIDQNKIPQTPTRKREEKEKKNPKS
jgi:hypothetical protein